MNCKSVDFSNSMKTLLQKGYRFLFNLEGGNQLTNILLTALPLSIKCVTHNFVIRYLLKLLAKKSRLKFRAIEIMCRVGKTIYGDFSSL